MGVLDNSTNGLMDYAGQWRIGLDGYRMSPNGRLLVILLDY